MKTWTIMLTVSALASVIAIPLVNAEEGCSRADIADGAIPHPTKEKTYLFLGPDADKIGEWTEWNGRAGLQTVNCLSASGSLRYAKDLHVSLVG